MGRGLWEASRSLKPSSPGGHGERGGVCPETPGTEFCPQLHKPGGGWFSQTFRKGPRWVIRSDSPSRTCALLMFTHPCGTPFCPVPPPLPPFLPHRGEATGPADPLLLLRPPPRAPACTPRPTPSPPPAPRSRAPPSTQPSPRAPSWLGGHGLPTPVPAATLTPTPASFSPSSRAPSRRVHAPCPGPHTPSPAAGTTSGVSPWLTRHVRLPALRVRVGRPRAPAGSQVFGFYLWTEQVSLGRVQPSSPRVSDGLFVFRRPQRGARRPQASASLGPLLSPASPQPFPLPSGSTFFVPCAFLMARLGHPGPCGRTARTPGPRLCRPALPPPAPPCCLSRDPCFPRSLQQHRAPWSPAAAPLPVPRCAQPWGERASRGLSPPGAGHHPHCFCQVPDY